jgi:outer membrane usher protein FimD/PapC
MSITYSRSENISKSPGTETQKNQSESLSCGIQSTAFDDKLSWNLRFSSGITEDLLADRKTKNYDISLGFGLPIITDKLSVNFSISPYNFTKNYLPVGDYTEINQQNYNTSFNFRISERLNTSFGISLNRSKSRINGTTEVTSSALGNDLNLAYRLKNLNISYNLNLTKSNNSRTESNLININILPPIKRISNINLSYGLVRTKSSDIIRRKSQNFSLTSGVINLTEHTNLNLGINLSLPEEDVRNSQINVGMWYSIGKLSTGFNFSDNRRKEKGALVNKSQNYQINLGHHGITVFKKSIPISLSHTYNIAGITKDQKSKSQSLNFSTSLPITQRINFGYAYSWNKSDKTKSNINNFNLRLSGEKRAYSLDTSLKLIKTNNDKLREDVALSFEYPLAKDLSLSTGLYFTSQDKEEPLYNFTSGLVYSF